MTELTLPCAVFLLTVGLKQKEPPLELTARSLGEHPVRAFFDMTLPQIKFSILSTFSIPFLTSSMTLSSHCSYPVAIWRPRPRRCSPLCGTGRDPLIAAVATLLTAVSIIMPLASQWRSAQRRWSGLKPG